MTMKAIISPYEPSLNPDRDGTYYLAPCVVIDTEATYFSSSDMPESIPSEGERLIHLEADAHAEAVALGYVEVEVGNLWQS